MRAQDVPKDRRMESPSSFLVHIRSPWTIHWTATGTPLCNDAQQLQITPDADQALPVCKRCAVAFAREATS